uniref:Uncharacterized protein n=1 Tax=Oryza meridionalis TaxID=40149 RepID=A0A0E0EYG0_9ORYZ
MTAMGYALPPAVSQSAFPLPSQTTDQVVSPPACVANLDWTKVSPGTMDTVVGILTLEIENRRLNEKLKAKTQEAVDQREKEIQIRVGDSFDKLNNIMKLMNEDIPAPRSINLLTVVSSFEDLVRKLEYLLADMRRKSEREVTEATIKGATRALACCLAHVPTLDIHAAVTNGIGAETDEAQDELLFRCKKAGRVVADSV